MSPLGTLSGGINRRPIDRVRSKLKCNGELPLLAESTVGARVPQSGRETIAARQATHTIPIVSRARSLEICRLSNPPSSN